MLSKSLQYSRQCRVTGCQKPVTGRWGSLCNACAKQLATHGTLTRGTTRHQARSLRPMFKRVAACLPESVIHELTGLLINLPSPPRQGDVHKLTHARDRAMYVLAWISKQRGHEEAARAILSRAIAVELIPKPTSAPRYRVASIARAVHGLLRTDKSLVLYGRVEPKRISLQGRRAQEHLVALIEKTYCYDLAKIRADIDAGKGRPRAYRRKGH